MIRELSHRISDGIAVSLLWDTETNQVHVAVTEDELGTSFTFGVAAADAPMHSTIPTPTQPGRFTTARWPREIRRTT